MITLILCLSRAKQIFLCGSRGWEWLHISDFMSFQSQTDFCVVQVGGGGFTPLICNSY